MWSNNRTHLGLCVSTSSFELHNRHDRKCNRHGVHTTSVLDRVPIGDSGTKKPPQIGNRMIGFGLCCYFFAPALCLGVCGSGPGTDGCQYSYEEISGLAAPIAYPHVDTCPEDGMTMVGMGGFGSTYGMQHNTTHNTTQHNTTQHNTTTKKCPYLGKVRKGQQSLLLPSLESYKKVHSHA